MNCAYCFSRLFFVNLFRGITHEDNSVFSQNVTSIFYTKTCCYANSIVWRYFLDLHIENCNHIYQATPLSKKRKNVQ